MSLLSSGLHSFWQKSAVFIIFFIMFSYSLSAFKIIYGLHQFYYLYLALSLSLPTPTVFACLCLCLYVCVCVLYSSCLRFSELCGLMYVFAVFGEILAFIFSKFLLPCFLSIFALELHSYLWRTILYLFMALQCSVFLFSSFFLIFHFYSKIIFHLWYCHFVLSILFLQQFCISFGTVWGFTENIFPIHIFSYYKWLILVCYISHNDEPILTHY